MLPYWQNVAMELIAEIIQTSPGPVIDVEVQKALPTSHVITSEPEKETVEVPKQLETFTFRLSESEWEVVDLH